MNNIEVGDLIKVNYGMSSFWGNYWKSRNLGIPAAIHSTRISDIDDDMRTHFIPDGTILPVLSIKTIKDEDRSLYETFLVLDSSGRLLWVDESFVEKYQPEPKETQ